MRIAILTQPLGHNYGGVLQAYALQYTLKRMGHDPIIVEQEYLQQINIFKLFLELPKRLLTKYIIKKRKYIFSEHKNNLFQIKRRKLTKPFIDENIQQEFVTNYNSIDLSQFEAFIVGSDQVWRPEYNEDIYRMFLSFIPYNYNIKRIAYAASFGTKEWVYTHEQTKKCSELLSRFDTVSVREIDGIDLCKEYFKREDAVCVLDPTLLLDRNDYEHICKNIPCLEGNTLCAYILDLNNDIEFKLKTIADKKRLKLKIVSADNNCTLSIPEWITMFRDAKCIITDSFHGTVFSIIFNKEFYSITNIERGGSRFTSLLSLFGLINRLNNSINEISSNNTKINWALVNQKLHQLRKYSIKFLTSTLS